MCRARRRRDGRDLVQVPDLGCVRARPLLHGRQRGLQMARLRVEHRRHALHMEEEVRGAKRLRASPGIGEGLARGRAVPSTYVGTRPLERGNGDVARRAQALGKRARAFSKQARGLVVTAGDAVEGPQRHLGLRDFERLPGGIAKGHGPGDQAARLPVLKEPKVDVGEVLEGTAHVRAGPRAFGQIRRPARRPGWPWRTPLPSRTPAPSGSGASPHSPASTRRSLPSPRCAPEIRQASLRIPAYRSRLPKQASSAAPRLAGVAGGLRTSESRLQAAACTTRITGLDEEEAEIRGAPDGCRQAQAMRDEGAVPPRAP